MTPDPVVTAITIFLDEEPFLAEAIESVLAQTYPHWELLLVDDGSTDGSTAIAQGYASRYPDRIRYLEHAGHANRGTGASRQLGLSHARGRYVGFLDGDDTWSSNKLEHQVDVLDRMPSVGMTYGQTLIWYSWDARRPTDVHDYLKPIGLALERVLTPPAVLIAFLENEYLCPGCGSVLLRRSAIEDAGGFDEAFRGQYEDMVVYAKLLFREAVYIEDRCYSRYRQHEGNNWIEDRRAARFWPEWLTPSRRRYLVWMERFLAEQQAGPAVRRALDTALWPYRHPLRYGVARTYHLARYYLGRGLRRMTAPSTTVARSQVTDDGERPARR